MRVFILGATGSIGAAVSDALLAHGHELVALARSDEAERQLQAKAIAVVRGDLRQPEAWAHTVRTVDAVIHVAATFSEDMGEVDRAVVEALVEAAAGAPKTVRFVITGGCWLFGETGDRVADETSPYQSIPSFAWMIDHADLVLKAPHLEAMLVHPAMVYSADGGVLSRFITSAREQGRIEVWGSLKTRWPVVHRADLAEAYRLVLERGAPGQAYCVAAEEGVQVGHMAETLSKRLGLTQPPLVRAAEEVMAEQGDWAAGPMLDQHMSGQKIRNSLQWSPQHPDILKEIG